MLFHLLNENLSTLNVKNLGRLQIQLKHFEGKIPAGTGSLPDDRRIESE